MRTAKFIIDINSDGDYDSILKCIQTKIELRKTHLTNATISGSSSN
jgi:hypothetical protein